MKVTKILAGDIVRGMVQLKNRPCVVIAVHETYVLACPLTTVEPKDSKLKSDTTAELATNRFLKDKSYYTYSTIQMPIQDAKDNMIGSVSPDTLKEINHNLKREFNNTLV